MFGDGYRFGLRQRTTTVNLVGGATGTVAVLTGLEGAISVKLKYHSGTGTEVVPSTWIVRDTWDGSTLPVAGNDYTILGTQTLSLKTAEASAPSLTFHRGRSQSTATGSSFRSRSVA